MKICSHLFDSFRKKEVLVEVDPQQNSISLDQEWEVDFSNGDVPSSENLDESSPPDYPLENSQTAS